MRRYRSNHACTLAFPLINLATRLIAARGQQGHTTYGLLSASTIVVNLFGFYVLLMPNSLPPWSQLAVMLMNRLLQIIANIEYIPRVCSNVIIYPYRTRVSCGRLQPLQTLLLFTTSGARISLS